ncbi:CDK5 regulatory subunit-associated protein 2-like [Osmerus mordax]|uniref:CDK5 regulatory subunit-associated protein 2-like n=1 Tax=Osmerus mordax TaxID=8014 RepID=UPI00350ECDD2
MANCYRTLSQHLNDLKKENFSLKLRIYFLEERIQGKYVESSDDVYRTNIVLKVEVESLKQELAEKQQQLDKALTTAESLTNHNETTLQKRCEERQQEIDHMLLEEAQLGRSEAGRRAPLAGSRSQTSLLSLEVSMEDSPEEGTGPSLLPHTHTRPRQGDCRADQRAALQGKPDLRAKWGEDCPHPEGGAAGGAGGGDLLLPAAEGEGCRVLPGGAEQGETAYRAGDAEHRAEGGGGEPETGTSGEATAAGQSSDDSGELDQSQ